MKPNYICHHLEAIKIARSRRGYGTPEKNLATTAQILDASFGIKLRPSEIAAVFFANKLAREKQSHNPDNLPDAQNYLAMREDLKLKNL